METIRNWALPLLLAAGQGVLLWPGTGLYDTPGTGVIGVVCVLAVETAALGRRRHTPVRALACTLVTLVLGTLAWPAGYLGISVLVALYSVAVRCPLPVTVRALAAAVGVEWLLVVAQDGFGVPLLGELAVALGAYVLCAGLGEARRQWLAGRLTAVRRLAGAEQTRLQAADQERRRLARELHDVSAHHLTSVVVTVDAACRLKDSRPELAAEARGFAERTGAETLTALQRLVGLLRDADGPGPRPSSAQIEELVAGFGRLGRPVTAHIPADLAGTAAEAVHGIVREALTNALRHAPGAAARVAVRRKDGLLDLTVENGPPRTSAQPCVTGLGGGRGVSGMRDRAAAAGGELTAGPTRDGGWRVHAALPDTAEPRHQQPEQAWRRDVLREQRLADPALAFTAWALPVVCALAVAEDWPARTRGAAAPQLLVIAVLLALHALPLLWRRRAPGAAFLAVPVTALLAAVSVVPLHPPSHVVEFLAGGTLVEPLALYAVAAYGQGAARTWPAVAAASFAMASVLAATACADGAVAGEPAGWGDVVATTMALSVLLAPALACVWVAGLLVRRRRLRALAYDDFAFASTIWHADRTAEAERRRLAATLRDAVLRHTATLVETARQGSLEDVAEAARAALSAMRDMLHGLGRAEDSGSRLAPSPTAADLEALCRTLGAGGREVRLRGLPEAARDLPPSLQISVYRIVEAALAAGDRGPARVALRRRRDAVRITVTGVRLAVTGPVAERLRVQVAAGEGRIALEPTGTLRVSLPTGPVPVPDQEVSPSPYA